MSAASGCDACGASEGCVCVLPLSRDARTRAHLALDKWLNDCVNHADWLRSLGQSGHLGSFKLEAESNDDETKLTIRQALYERI